MYYGFKFELSEFSDLFNTEEKQALYHEGKQGYLLHQHLVHKALDYYLLPDGSLSASEIEKDWFPNVHADVFLSHSHKDLNQVMQFAGFLSICCGLRVFVDSAIWGYADDLLEHIDEKYYVIERNADHTVKTYSHEGSKYASSHVNLLCKSQCQVLVSD